MDISMGEKIKTRRLALELSLRDLAAKADSTASTIRKWETGDISSMKTEKLKKLAKALDCDPLWLMGLTEDPKMINNVIETVEAELVPIVGRIPCGSPVSAEENHEGNAYGPPGADFALRAKGDSMINARIYDGDIVFIKEQPTVENGEIAAVLIDGEATLKRVYTYPHRIELRPENPLSEVLEYEEDDMKNVRILGKAISIMGQIR